MFWPSGVKRSFGGFVGSMFIVGSGLSTLETSANPFIATCGPPRYSELRLNLSQSFQAIGSVVAPLLAARVFFANVGSKDLSTVQWTYLGVAGFVFCLAIVFYFAPIPEVTDSDMADGEECVFLLWYIKIYINTLPGWAPVSIPDTSTSHYINSTRYSGALPHNSATWDLKLR
jgi:FHS family L-fucose permease-like MFS transporter